MRIQGSLILNYLLFFTFTIVLTSLQGSLWMQFFGYFPSPQLWTITFAYWISFRRPAESLIMVYLLTMITISMSNIPGNLMLFVLILLYIVSISIKNRIFWPSTTFIMLLVLINNLLFPILHVLGSFLTESHPITDPEILDWVLSSLITALFAIPVTKLYFWIDRLTKKELPSEAGSTSYE